MQTDELKTIVPSHVPAELVVDLDIYNLPNDRDDAHRAWQQFRGHGPIVFTPRNGGHWVAVDGQDIMAMWRDAETFSSASVSIPSHDGERQLPIEADAPDHAAYRANVIAFFMPGEVRALEDEVRSLAIKLIESFRERGECEFTAEFAEQLPLIVFLSLMGLPQEDRIELHDWVEAFARDPDPAVKLDANNKLRAYLRGWIAKRQENPGTDAISRITQAQIDGRPYTLEEMESTCTLLLLGGLDTVASSLGFWVLHLANNPAQREEIRTRTDSLLPVINEFMRRYPIPSLGRIVTRDVEHHGVLLKQGDRLLLSPALHNLDPEIYPEPEQVRFDRPSRHVGFGAGPHMCVGANLARLEFRIFLEEWLTRIPDFQVKPGTTPLVKAAPTNTVEELWLSWN